MFVGGLEFILCACLFLPKAWKVLGFGERGWKSLDNGSMTNPFDLMMFINIYECEEQQTISFKLVFAFLDL